MNDEAEPGTARWGAELRRLRQLAGKRQHDLAKGVGYQPSTVSAWERGTRRPDGEQIARLDDALSTGGALAALWADLSSNGALPDRWRSFINVEREAVEIREYAAMLIPGLLQSETYAREILRRDPSTEELVAVRTERITKLHEDVRIWVVIEESAVRRVVRSPMVQADAVGHLLHLASQPHIQVALIPAEAWDRPGLAGSFRVVRVPDGRMVGHAEHQFGEVVVSAPQVTKLLGYFSDLQMQALSQTETIRQLEKMKEEFNARVAQEHV
ncbi:helix-turn-helix transcriptional regulator [Nocardiopsis sp. RSe5-2]|uniref:Helix-turn-helix transcriptional regulator n=1 Tax=Nocardiopsis endophytica TaxID=3018445 RepID=A0ABT4UBG7_9ACTN|nr:helix-turn-helix transcriptional regulator [Nocardiopsis endophytica]MDA2814253.1 helix-turn-helix transcriptional regulator [Nocardiopsis endophytica]